MSGIFGSKEKAAASMVPAVTAQAPTPAPARSDAETASLAASQRERYTRRRGRAVSMLTGQGASAATGGMSVARMLGSVART